MANGKSLLILWNVSPRTRQFSSIENLLFISAKLWDTLSVNFFASLRIKVKE